MYIAEKQLLDRPFLILMEQKINIVFRIHVSNKEVDCPLILNRALRIISFVILSNIPRLYSY